MLTLPQPGSNECVNIWVRFCCGRLKFIAQSPQDITSDAFKTSVHINVFGTNTHLPQHPARTEVYLPWMKRTIDVHTNLDLETIIREFMWRAVRSCLIMIGLLSCFTGFNHTSTSRDVWQPQCDTLSRYLYPVPMLAA